MSETSSHELKFKNSTKDWAARAALFAIFLFFGARKFDPGSNSAWIQLYNDIGFGQWLRYVTGILELTGAFLALLPRTVEAGLVLLGTVMVGATFIDIVVLRRYADAFVPIAIFCALIALGLHRRRV